MTTVVLSAALSVTPLGPIAGPIIGGIIGGYIDGMLMSALFGGSTPLTGPRLDDLRIQTRAEGSPIPRVHGRRVRIAGVVVWGPPLIEEAHNRSGGGGKGVPGGGQGSDVTSFTYYLNTAVKLADTRHLPGGAAVSIHKLWANSKLIFDASEVDADSLDYDDMRFFTGDAAQTADSLIIAFEGVHTPAYRGSCGFVIERLDMTEIGTSSNFEALIEPEAVAPTVGVVIGRELELGGLTPDEYDVSGISLLKVVEGISIVGPQEPAQVIAALQTAYNVVHSDWGGKLRFYDRGTEPTISVVDADFSGTKSGAPSPVRRKRLDERELPSSISVTFFEASCDYQQSSRTAFAEGVAGHGTASLSLPLVLTGGKAHNIATTTLWSTRGSTVEWEAWLPPSFSDVSVNEILLWTDTNGVQRRMRILAANEGSDHSMRCSGSIEQAHTFEQEESQVESDRECDAGDAPAGTMTGLLMMYFTEAPLHAGAVDIYGGYRAWADGSKRLQRRLMHFSEDVNTNYHRDYAHPQPTLLGSLVTALPAAKAESNGGLWFEYGTSIQVSMANNAEGNLAGADVGLQTRSEEDVIRGANTIIVQTDDGSHEVCAYLQATDLGSDLWLLTGILRGMRATELHASQGSSIGSLFCSANEMALSLRGRWGTTYPSFVPSPRANAPGNMFVKAANTWEDLSAKPEIQVHNTQSTRRPFAPTDLKGRRDDSGNLLIGMRRRPRAVWDGFLEEGYTLGFLPVMDSGFLGTVLFQIDIEYGGSVVRTLEVDGYFSTSSDKPTNSIEQWTSTAAMQASGMMAFEYTSAMHASDGVPLHAPVIVKGRHITASGTSPDVEETI